MGQPLHKLRLSLPPSRAWFATAWLAASLLVFVACQKISVPEDYSKLSFAGLQKIEVEDGSVVLSWNSLSESQSESQIEYQVYMAKLDTNKLNISSALSGTSSGTLDSSPQSLTLPDEDQPKNAGILLKSVASDKYTVEKTLEEGVLYGFQVIAASGPKKGDNSVVFALAYLSSKSTSGGIDLAPTAGNFQLGTAGKIFATPLKVKLTKNDEPMAGEIITFTISQGGGNLSTATAVTDSEGVASTIYTAGPSAGTCEIVASWNNGARDTKFILIANTDSATQTKLEIAGGNFQIGQIGQSFASPLKVRLVAGSAPMPGETITFHLSSGNGAVLSQNTVTTNSLGEASITATAGPSTGTCLVTASWNSGESIVEFQLIAQADSTQLNIAGGNYQNGSVSSAFAIPLKVRLMGSDDPNSYKVGEPILFSVTTGSGAALSSTSVNTNASGYAQTIFTAGSSAGTYEVTASWNSGQRTAVFSLQANTSQDLKVLEIVSGNIQAGATSAAFAAPLKVRLKDNGVAMAGEVINFAVATTPSGAAGTALSSATGTTNGSGETSVNFTSGDKAGTYEVTATWGTKTVTFSLIVAIDVAATSKIIKIVATGAGAQPEVTTAALDLATDTLTVKAAFYDLTGTTFISDAVVAWSLVGGGFNGADLTGTAAGATSITLSPTRTGTTTLQATYMGSDTTVIGTTDSTGFITVSSSITPQVIAVVAGDNQTAVVGNNLTTTLKVKVTNSSNVAVPGEGVNFTTQQGGGVVVSAQPTLTDANGFAEATVQLGQTAMTNIFRATVVSTPSLTHDFQATATPGAASKLAFSTQPGLAYQSFKFLTQPIVIVQDTYGNLVTTANHSISLAIGAGSGALIGTATATAVNGIATFTDVGSDTQQVGMTLVASATPALTTATSNSFTVNGPLTSACTTEDISWKTTEGGCKDLNSGMVWSGSYYNLSLYSCIWDASVSGASPMDSDDNGWSNEYDGADGQTWVDTSSSAQCHDLSLGGYTDWRMPTLGEMQLARSNGLVSHQSSFNSSTSYWSASRAGSTTWQAYRFDTAAASTLSPTATYRCVCVRSNAGRPAPTQLVVTSSPTGNQLIAPSTISVTLAVRDAGNQKVMREGLSITASLVSGSGTLGGTLTKTTGQSGTVTFSDLTYSASGTPTIRFTAAAISASVDLSTVSFISSPGGCTPDASWDDTEGGCKDLQTGLVWSMPAGARTWYDTVWDYNVAGAAAPEASDNGWTNEYAATLTTPCEYTGGCDTTAADYCHSLLEGGYDDWRMPSVAEMQNARTHGIHTKKTFVTGTYSVYYSYESSSGAPATDALGFSFANNTTAGQTKNQAWAYPICVRGGSAKPAPAKLMFVNTTWSAQTNTTMPAFKVKVVSSSGAQINRSGENITLAVASGTGALSGTLVAATDQAGIATFSSVQYDTKEVVTLTATAASGFTPPSTSMTINVGDYPGTCMVDDASFSSTQGGCKDLVNGKVWSAVSTSKMTYHQAIWDSALSGNTAPDADDGVRTKDVVYIGGTYTGDASLANYCHDRTEGGYTDWRVPTWAELQGLDSHGAATHITNLPTTAWEATWEFSNPSYSWVYNFSTHARVLTTAGASVYVICIRP